jgi:hypothetical protein
MTELTEAEVQLAKAAALLELANFYTRSIACDNMSKRSIDLVLKSQADAQLFYNQSADRYQKAWIAKTK